MAYVRKSAPPPRPDFSWHDAAACRGEDLWLFFGSDGERSAEREIREAEAKKICIGCPVREECLDQALSRPERAGIFGGLNPEERHTTRRRLARHRREAAA